ncbi:MAG: glycoside hydrolase domain-containing protein [Thermoguttaceae bacterium]
MRFIATVSAVLAVVGLSSGHCRAASDRQEVPYGVASVACFKQPPTVDGRLEPGEWDGALRITGFQAIFGSTTLEARSGTAYFGFSRDRLYIAVVSEYPPDGKDHSSGTARDKDYIRDECLEIWLDPNRDHRAEGRGDLRYYQMNCNAQGGIYDVSFDPKTGPDTGWNGHWDYKSTVDHSKHLWTAEISLPLADLGWTSGQAIGKTLGVLIARNYKAPWVQSTWFPVRGAFIDWYRYAAIKLTDDAPTVQITSLGEKVHTGQLQLRARIVNPGAARKAKVSLRITSSDMPELKQDRLLDLPAGGAAAYAYDVPQGRLHESAQHDLVLDVVSPDGGVTYLHYALKWSRAPQRKWEYEIGPDREAAVRLAYYPSYRMVRVQVDPRQLGKDPAQTSRKAQVVIAAPDSKKVVEQTIAWEQPPGLKEFDVGELPDGQYRLTVMLDGCKEPFVRTFKRIRFPWEGNRLGVTDEVLPPLKPIRVEGTKIAVVSREYSVDGLGLWQSVRAEGNVSAGGMKELLAAPLALVADGTVLKGQGRFTKVAAQAVVYEGQARHPAVTVRSRCTTECDGCTKVELTLDPSGGNRPLGSLHLDIPLKDVLAPLWHVSTSGLRINPAGATPSGQGIVWDSTKFPDGEWFGNFKCYLWLGGEERGLCWFADNDRGWELDADAQHPENSAACQQLIRKDGVLTLRVNLVQKPVVIASPRTITFGLMASPAKPMPADWRRRDIREPSKFNMGYANIATFCGKMPWGNDFSIADWAYAKRTGKPGPTAEQLEAWKQRNFPADMQPKFRQDMINLALGPFLGTFGPGQKYYKIYFEEFHTTSQVHPESHVFQSEWSGDWQRPLVDRETEPWHHEAGINNAGIVASYRDFACWYAAQWVRRGIGCYFDNAFPMRAYDPLTTSAYRLSNGQIQPSAGIWARREYLKRIWVIHRQLPPPDALPAMMIHMTNTHILPYMVWNDENLDLEWKFGPEPQQSKFPHDFLRAETLGRQSGNVPWGLDRIVDHKTAEEKRIAHRTRFGVMMVHEIRWWGMGEDVEGAMLKAITDFGYAQDDCRVLNYWDDGFPVKTSDPEAKTLLLKRGKELLLLVCTWNPKPAQVRFDLDLKALGVSPAAAFNTEEPSERLFWNVTGGELKLAIEGYGVRIVRLK